MATTMFRKSYTSTLHKIIDYSGKIVAPAGVVAIVCAVMSVSTLSTAFISLVVTLITATMLFWHPIDRFVPSPIIICLIFFLSTVFFFTYKNILAKDTGLIKFWKPSAEIITPVHEHIRGAKSLIVFYGTNFHITTVDGRKEIMDCLSNGVKVHYLVFNPYSENLKAVAHDFGQTPEELSRECLTGLSNLLSIKSRWERTAFGAKPGGELEIRLFSEFPRLRAYFFDPTDERSECFVVPYLHYTNSPELPGFQFENQRDGVFGAYFGSMEELWKKSVDIASVVQSHPELKSLADGQ